VSAYPAFSFSVVSPREAPAAQASHITTTPVVEPNKRKSPSVDANPGPRVPAVSFAATSIVPPPVATESPRVASSLVQQIQVKSASIAPSAAQTSIGVSPLAQQSPLKAIPLPQASTRMRPSASVNPRVVPSVAPSAAPSSAQPLSVQANPGASLFSTQPSQPMPASAKVSPLETSSAPETEQLVLGNFRFAPMEFPIIPSGHESITPVKRRERFFAGGPDLALAGGDEDKFNSSPTKEDKGKQPMRPLSPPSIPASKSWADVMDDDAVKDAVPPLPRLSRVEDLPGPKEVAKANQAADASKAKHRQVFDDEVAARRRDMIQRTAKTYRQPEYCATREECLKIWNKFFPALDTVWTDITGPLEVKIPGVYFWFDRCGGQHPGDMCTYVDHLTKSGVVAWFADSPDGPLTRLVFGPIKSGHVTGAGAGRIIREFMDACDWLLEPGSENIGKGTKTRAENAFRSKEEIPMRWDRIRKGIKAPIPKKADAGSSKAAQPNASKQAAK